MRDLPTPERGASALAVLAGASAWLSLGALAIIDTRSSRVGVVPSFWLLATLIPLGLAAAALVRLRTADSWPLAITLVLWLPWLPTTVLPAVLIWDGPLEILVWGVALSGVVVARVARTMSRISDGRRAITEGVDVGPAWRPFFKRAPWLAGVVMLACSLGGAAALARWLPAGDEPHYLVITQSLLRDGDLKIENNHARGDFFEYVDDAMAPDYLQRGIDGAIYSVHAPGLSVLVLPFFAAAGYGGAVMAVALCSALAVALVWRAVFLLTNQVTAAWVGTLAFASSATFFFHSFTIFPDPVGGTAIAVALWLLATLEAAPLSIGPRAFALCGGVLGLLPWLHTRFVLLAVALGVLIVARAIARADRWRCLAAFAVAPVISAASWFAFFWMIYGTPNPAAPYGGSTQNSSEWLARGLTGLALDQQFGLVTNAPIMVFLPFGLYTLWRVRPRLAIELVSVTLPYLFTVASFGMWWGGWSGPARFLVPLMPLTAPVLAYSWIRGGTAVRLAMTALTAVGLLNVVVRMTVDDGALLYNVRDGYDLLLDWLSRNVNMPLAFPSAHRLGTEQTLLLGSIWVVAGAAALLALTFVARKTRGIGAWWAAVSGLLLVSSSVAMTASWAVIRIEPVTVVSSELEFLRRWQPALRTVGVALPDFRRMSPDSTIDVLELRSSTRARDLPQEPALFAAKRVPAGNYHVVIDGPPILAGALTVSIGSTSQVVENWRLADTSAGNTGLILNMPTLADSVTIRGDSTAVSRIRGLTLRPQVPGYEILSKDSARRAARYGTARLFFLDDALLMEPTGVWTRGNATGEVFVTIDQGTTADIEITAGPVAVVVNLDSDGWSERVGLRAGERRRLQVPAGRLRIATSGAFRPNDHDAGNGDRRSLGARIEFP